MGQARRGSVANRRRGMPRGRGEVSSVDSGDLSLSVACRGRTRHSAVYSRPPNRRSRGISGRAIARRTLRPAYSRGSRAPERVVFVGHVSRRFGQEGDFRQNRSIEIREHTNWSSMKVDSARTEVGDRYVRLVQCHVTRRA